MKSLIEFHCSSHRLHIKIGYGFLILLTIIGTSIKAGEWQQESSLNTARYGATAVVLNGYIYVMGGVDQSGLVLNTVERYDTTSRTWSSTAVPHFDDPRLDAAAIVFDGKIYLSGGFNHDGEITDEVEIYDPVLNKWSEGEKMRRDRRGHVLLQVNQQLCVMGGIRDLNNTYEPEIEYLEGDDWRQAPDDLPTPVAGPFAVGVSDRVYLFGGIFNTPVVQSSTAIVDTAWQFTWSALPPLSEARGSGATIVKNDSIFLFGGITLNGNTTDMTETFVISSGQITDGPTLNSPRASLAAVNLDDVIYVIGGYSSSPSQPLNLVESYQTITGITEPRPLPPMEFVQISGYPNPFNGIINLKVKHAHASNGNVSIFDITGKKVVELANGFFPAGEQIFSWDGRDSRQQTVTSGVYFAVFKNRGFSKVIKLVYSR